MLGIVAAVAREDIVDVLIDGLNKLECRGYDSAGLVVSSGQGMRCLRSAGRVAVLERRAEGLRATAGIVHTRRPTHGVPCERNAHPHASGGVAVVHYGIIKNHEALREELQDRGYAFSSDNGTETIAHLVEEALRDEPDLFAAVLSAIARLASVYGIAVIDDVPQQ